MTDYYYISLSLRTINSDGQVNTLISFGKDIIPEFTGNPLEMFVNADEIYVFDTSGNQNIISLWKETADNIIVATLGIDKGCKVKPLSVISLLRECVEIPDFKAEELFEMYGFHTVASHFSYPHEATPSYPKATRTYTSTSSLADIVSARFSGGDREAAIIIAVNATAVPIEDENTLVRLHTAPVPDFVVENKYAAPKPQPEPTPEPRRSFYNDLYPQTYIEDDDEEEYVPYPKKMRRKRNRIILFVFILIALTAGWAAVKYLPEVVPESEYSQIESTDVTEIAMNEAANNGNRSQRYHRADRQNRGNQNNASESNASAQNISEPNAPAHRASASKEPAETLESINNDNAGKSNQQTPHNDQSNKQNNDQNNKHADAQKVKPADRRTISNPSKSIADASGESESGAPRQPVSLIEYTGSFISKIGSTDQTDKEEAAKNNKTKTKTKSTPEAAEKAKPVEKPKNAEAADIEYLNSHRVWSRRELKSDKYRALFDLFGAGNISGIVNSDFFMTRGRCKNNDADKAVTLLWQAYNTDTQLSNVRALKKLAGKDKIDMHKLMDDLSRLRSPKPNTKPRPKH